MTRGGAAEAGRLYDGQYRRVSAEPRCGDNFAIRIGANGYRRLGEARLDAGFIKAAARPGSLLLDLGCGTGGYAVWLARRTGLRPIGIDASYQGLRHAVRRFPGHAFVQGDVARLPFACGSIVAAVSLDVLHCLPAPSRLFGELARLLPRGGRAVVVALATTDDVSSAEIQIERWRALARQAGLKECDVEDLTAPWRCYMYARHAERLRHPAGWAPSDLAVSRAMLGGVIDRSRRIGLRLESQV